MAAPAPVPPPIVLGLGIGLLGFILYRMVKGLATPFSTVNGVQFWHQDQANAIRMELEGAHLEEIAGAPRTFMVLPGVPKQVPDINAPVPQSALAQVKAMQAQKHIVTSSTNLLDKSAQRFVAEVLPAEEKTLATGDVIAVLPPL